MAEQNANGDEVLQALYETEPWNLPEDTKETVLVFLRDREALESDRIKAAHLAGDFVVVDDEAAEALLAVVSDSTEPDALRASAAIALGPALDDFDTNSDDVIDGPAISKPVFLRVDAGFQEVYNDGSTPKVVRRRVLEASIRAPQDWHEGAVREAFAQNDQEWTVTALFCAGYLGAFQDDVRKALNSDDEAIYLQAVRAAGDLELTEGWPHIARILQSPSCDKELLLAAIYAAAGVGQEEAAELVEEYLHHEDEDIADAARETMMFINDGVYDDEEFEDEDLEDEEDE